MEVSIEELSIDNERVYVRLLGNFHRNSDAYSSLAFCYSLEDNEARISTPKRSSLPSPKMVILPQANSVDRNLWTAWTEIYGEKWFLRCCKWKKVSEVCGCCIERIGQILLSLRKQNEASSVGSVVGSSQFLVVIRLRTDDFLSFSGLVDQY